MTCIEFDDEISLNEIDYELQNNIDKMVNDIAIEQAKRLDKIVLKTLQEKFNTTETDPIKLKQMLDDANLEMSFEKISEEIKEADKGKNAWTYECKTVFVPVFKTKE